MDREKFRQALEEWKHTFIVLVTPLFLVFTAGFQVGDGRDQFTVFPNLEMVKAFVVGILCAAVLAALKSAWWYITGTKVAPRRSRRSERGAVSLMDVLVILAILVVIVLLIRLV